MMSKDTIYREDALNALLQMDGTKIDKALAMGEIRSIPSVDRPRGKWIETTYAVWDGTDEEHKAIYRSVPTVKCSNCGKLSPFQRLWIVCPYCDAKMEGADDESLRANGF